jgi:hypothetical protein
MPTREERNNFSKRIMEIANKNGISHLDAMSEFCGDSGLEPEVAAKLINNTLKQHLAKDAVNLKLIKPDSTARPLR